MLRKTQIFFFFKKLLNQRMDAAKLFFLLHFMQVTNYRPDLTRNNKNRERHAGHTSKQYLIQTAALKPISA